MTALEIQSLVKRWLDAQKNNDSEREAQLVEEIVEQVNKGLEEIKRSPTYPKFDLKFHALYVALKPMAEIWLMLQLMEKAGIHPDVAKISVFASQISNTFGDEKKEGKEDAKSH